MNHEASKTHTFSSASPQDTTELGRIIGKALPGGVVIGLVGPLGAGKTHLVKGIALGNRDGDGARDVTSPTFTLVHEYPGRLALFHLDAYRLKSAAEMLALGFDELCRPDSAVVIEWADRVRSVLPDDRMMLSFTITGDTTRSIAVEAQGPVARACLAAMQSAWEASAH